MPKVQKATLASASLKVVPSMVVTGAKGTQVALQSPPGDRFEAGSQSVSEVSNNLLERYPSKTSKELRDALAEMLHEVKYLKKIIIITQRNKISAVLVPIEALVKLELFEKRLEPERAHQKVVKVTPDQLRAVVRGREAASNDRHRENIRNPSVQKSRVPGSRQNPSS